MRDTQEHHLLSSYRSLCAFLLLCLALLTCWTCNSESPSPSPDSVPTPPRRVDTKEDGASANDIPRTSDTAPHADEIIVTLRQPEKLIVPEGEYKIGNSQDQLDAIVSLCLDSPSRSTCNGGNFSDILGVHRVVVSGFWLDQYEVSYGQYMECVDMGPCAKPQLGDNPLLAKPELPVLGVTWMDALQYCKWQGKTLPTEAQWEYAARGRLATNRFPWGNSPPSAQRARYCDGNCRKIMATKPLQEVRANIGPVPVRSMPSGATPEGVFHMAGNAKEYCLDTYDENAFMSLANRGAQVEDPVVRSDSTPISDAHPDKDTVVIRGGGWYSGPSRLEASRRREQNRHLAKRWGSKDPWFETGFRCAAPLDFAGDRADMAKLDSGFYRRGIPEAKLPSLVAECKRRRYQVKCTLHDLAMEFPKQTSVRLRAFEIDKPLVSQAAYALCAEEGLCTHRDSQGGGDFPATMVTWQDAFTYCKFAGKRLCTDTEWEVAATGGNGQQIFPWGNSAPTHELAGFITPEKEEMELDDKPKGARFAGPFGRSDLPLNLSPFRAHQMVGNVWQWTMPSDRAGQAQLCTVGMVPPGTASVGTLAPVRGGSSRTVRMKLVATRPESKDAALRFPDVGFRCCRDVPKEP